jgi:Alw26I/Eco31I/Esp3I family type II restriction m6 adenine DNA methyltransferase
MCKESLKESLKTKFPELQKEINLLIENHEDQLDFPQKNKIIAAITDIKVIDPACGSGAFPMGMFNLMVRTIEKLQEHKTTYKNKLDIITNCIYGIDIQNIAIEISKLRFFISLLVDYQTPSRIEDFDVLPNLETKFVVANSLIGINLKSDVNLFDFINEFRDLTKIFTPYTQAKSPQEKERIKNDFNKKKQEIVQNPNFEFGTEIKNKILQWNPFNVCYCSPFFDSAIMFGIADGFDIVIGNPPYKQVSKGLFSKEQFPYSESRDKGKQNLYKVFVESSYNLSKNDGIATMIVQSGLMCDLSSQFTRELLLTKTEISEIIEFPKIAKNKEGQVFESVLQGTCIYRFKRKEPHKDRLFKVSIDNDITTLNKLEYENLNQNEIIKFYPNGYFIPLVHINDFVIVRKMQKFSAPLKIMIEKQSQGDLNLTTESHYFSNHPTNVRLLRGRNTHRFHIDNDSNEYIQDNYKNEIVRLNQINKYFVCQQITGTTDKYRLHFAITELKKLFLFGNSVNKLLVDGEQINEQCLLGILNSKLIDWYFRKTSTNNHVNIYEIENLPIRNPPQEDQQSIATLVKYMQLLRNNNNLQVLNNVSNDFISNAIEKLIDACVYELYFEEEIKSSETDVLTLLRGILCNIVSLPIEKQINQLFTELNGYKNEIRNRIILQETRSESVSQIIKAKNE